MASQPASGVSNDGMQNGPGAAAVLAAGLGCFAIGAVSVAADKTPALARILNFYAPTGPLSGVSTVVIVLWLAAWALLHLLWRRRNIGVGRVVAIALALLAAGVLLTFPPFGDLF